MKQYEIIYIANPDLDDQSITDLNNKVAGWITESGGEVEKIDDWGKRRLAYRIQKQRDGHYVLINAKLDPTAIKSISSDLRFIENIFRYMITAVKSK